MENKITWYPEMFGFEPTNMQRVVFLNKNFELRRKPNNYWLMRKLKKNEDTKKSEMLVKWYHYISPDDNIFAIMLFTKGLK